MPELVFFRRGEEVLRFTLGKERVVLGRGERCDVVIPDPDISRQQVAISYDGETCQFEDLSGKDTLVVGKELKKGELPDGADIALGRWRAVFRERSSAETEDATGIGRRTSVQKQVGQEEELQPAQLRVKQGNTEFLHELSGESFTIPACGEGQFCGTDCQCRPVDAPLPDLVVDENRLMPPAPLSMDTIAALTSGDPDTARMLAPAELGETLVVDSVFLRPTLFPLGVAFEANALGGQISGNVGGRKEVQVRLKLDRLDTAQGNLPKFTGLDLEGTLSGTLNLKMPVPEGANGRPGEPDLSQADGELSLEGQNVLLKGSTDGGGGLFKGTTFGMLVQAGLPRIPVGDLTAQIRFEKGLGTVDALKLGGDQLEIRGTGKVKLGKRLLYIEPDMEVKLRVEQELQKSLGPVGLGLNILPPDKDDPKFRSGRLTGQLGRLAFKR